MSDQFHFFDEPLLAFGQGQCTDDPRDGLALFGPADQARGFPTHIAIGTEKGLDLPVREKMLGFSQFAQKLSGLLGRNLSAEEWLEQRTPKNGPLFVTIRSIRHAASPWHTFSIV